MTREVREYQLEVKASQYIILPEGSEILDIQVQMGKPTLYVDVRTDIQDNVARCIYMYKTGESFRGALPYYIGSVRINEEMLHFYEV